MRQGKQVINGTEYVYLGQTFLGREETKGIP